MRLGAKIKRNEEVVAVRKDEHGVTVAHKNIRTGEIGTLRADYVICTLPFHILAGIDADFSADVHAALKRIKYDHSLKVAFEAPRFWERQQIYGDISYVKNDTRLIWYPSHGFYAESGILSGAYANGDAAIRLGDQPLTALARIGLGLGDIVKMTVFLVADPSKDNKLDFAGLMTGYTKFFGTKEQPDKPARSAVQVVALVAPGALVEIEVIAVKPH